MALTIKSAFTEKSEPTPPALPIPFSHGESPTSCWTVLDPKDFPMAERSILIVTERNQCLALPYRQIKCTSLRGVKRIILLGTTHKVTVTMENARELYRHVFCGDSLIIYEWQGDWGGKPKKREDQVTEIRVEKLGVPPQDGDSNEKTDTDDDTPLMH